MIKKITLENLAGMIKRGFDENTKEHRAMINKFETLENDHGEIKLKLDKVVYRFEFEELARKMKKIEERVERLWALYQK